MTEPPHNGTRNRYESEKPGTIDRSRAEARIEELRSQGGVFVEAVRATRMPMAMTDPNLPGNPIVFANQSFLELTGYGMEEVLGQQPYFMNGLDTAPGDATRFREALEQDRDEHLETVQYKKDGSRFVASLFLSAFKDEAGGTLYHFLSWRDVTRRVDAEDDAERLRNAQTALRESEARLARALEAGELGVWELNLASLDAWRSPQHDRIFGYDTLLPEWTYDMFLDHVVPEDRGWVDARFQEATAAGQDWDFECRIRRADGDVRWIWAQGRIDAGAEGRPGRMKGMVRDITARKQSEVALRESEERLRRVLETETVAVLFFNPEGILVDANDAFLRNLGYTREQVESRSLTWERMTPPEWHPASREQMEKVQATGRFGPYEKEYLRADGSRLWMLFAGRDLGDGLFVEYAIDVTDRKRAEAAVRESDERYRLIVQSAIDYAIIITDAQDRIVDWLPGAEAVFGWAREEAIGRPGEIIFTPGDQEQGMSEREIETAAREGSAPNVRWHQRKDGRQVFIEGTVTPLRNEDGSIRGYLKIGQDVTERRHAQELLEASERRMRSLVTGIPQLVFRSNGRGERIWGSPQWAEYTGRSFEESIDLGWLEAVHPDDRERTLEAWKGIEERGEYYCEHRFCNVATGHYRWHQTRATPLRDERGRIVEWLGTSTDVEELRQLQRHTQTLLAELQHRVRNTLGVVRSIARRTARTSETVDEMAMHLEGRIGAFSRVQAAVTRNPEAGVDLASLVRDELLAHAAQDGESLSIKGPEVSFQPRAAETFSLAIHELATNSVKYGALSAERGRLKVRWDRKPADGAELLELVWEENGLDLPGGEPQRKGFGLELLERTLPYELEAETEVEFRREGLRFRMTMPLTEGVLA